MIHFCLGHQQNGIDVTILFLTDGPANEYAQQLGIKTYLLPHLFKLSQPIKLLIAVLWIRNFILQHDFKIIHATMAYGQIVTALATWLLPVKRVWYQHGPVAGTLDKLAILTPVDQIFFNSNFLKELHNSIYKIPIPLDKEFIVPYGIVPPQRDEDKIQEIKKSYAPTQHLFLLAGRICAWKGYETAIQALAQLQNISWKLLIVGSAFRASDKQYEQHLKELVNKLGLTTHITFLPFQTDIYNYFAAADTFIHCSNVAEPFGLVVAEAMLQETFVIGSSQGGVTDILQDGKTGFSFNSIDPTSATEQLKKKITQRLQLSPEIEQQLLHQAKKLISTRHNIAQAAAKLEYFYQRL